MLRFRQRIRPDHRDPPPAVEHLFDRSQVEPGASTAERLSDSLSNSAHSRGDTSATAARIGRLGSPAGVAGGR